MSTARVSVVIPVYNGASVIAQAIDSALAEEAATEILVIDDRSEDGIDAVMAAYEKEERVRYLKNESKLGASGSRNRGVAEATGDYIAFLDADDLWVGGKLEKQLAAMEASGAVLCATARELMKPDGALTGRILPVKERITYRELLKHNSISCSSVLLRREAAQRYPMCHEDSHEDYLLWLELLKEYGFACGVNEPLLRYRVSSSGKSGSKRRSAMMTFRVYRYHGLSFGRSVLCFLSYALHGIKKHYL